MIRRLLPLSGLLAFALLLEVVPYTGVVSAVYLPPLHRIAGALGQEFGRDAFWTALLDTLRTWLTGLAIAVGAGVVVGVVVGSVPLLRAATASTVEFLRPIPSVALIPLAVLLYGTGRTATLLLVVYASFWQVLVQVLQGVTDVDPVARDTARSYGLGRLARIRWLVWPTTLPYAVTGVRLAAAVALILTVTGELVIGTPGLGKEIALAQSGGAVAQMYALIVVTGLVGVVANVVTRDAEKRVLAWHPAFRKEAAA
ncbi:nitrate ABC transporter permease [Virgisporangium aliadipatigenens]|uniref:Nitrate ABC transporter permease n=1 Tax=Virgisporangium aliadipatigenens TaxID=741659 RepID=A0A8J4DMY8_9ACTN|nr:ABC transporter permease subunit [Virgisporangium aliadipatigenens]GIJ43271.1 nitrate ABC transporter permease [Virgisporangium aliadipatigenens]